MRSILLLSLGCLVSSSVLAGIPAPALPEPGIIELLSIGALAGLIVAIRKRRK